LTRPFWGWVSDHIGRENAIFIAFILEAIAVYALLQLIDHPLWFVALSGLCFFAWGNIFSLFPAITGDLYGNKWATTNYGTCLYRQGRRRRFCRTRRCLAVFQDRFLEQGFLGHDRLRSDRRLHGSVVAETAGGEMPYARSNQECDSRAAKSGE
jgi:hypothetical protein